MKILQLISSIGFFGAENVVLELSRELSSLEGIDNVIGVFENSQNSHTEIAQYAKADSLKTMIFKCNGKVDFETLFVIKKFIKNEKIDIIHTHGYKSNIYGFVVAKMLKKPIMSTCHNWIANDFKTKAYYLLDKFILSKFNKIVAVSEDIRDELLRNKVKKDKISLIYNGINIDKFNNDNNDLKREFNIGKKIKVIGIVARFTAEKGLSNLLHAAQKASQLFPDCVFLFVGDGPLRDDLVKKSVELGIKEKVIFTGLRSDIPEIYSTIDIFVLPSLKEGLPIVLLEAMAAKKSIITTNVGAIPKVIENKKEGILISPNNISALTEALICLLKDEELSKELSLNAYNKVTRGFSSKMMCAKYIGIYEEILQNTQ